MLFTTRMQDRQLLDRALDAAGYRGSWQADHRTDVVSHTAEIGSVLPLTSQQLAGPIPGTIFNLMIVEADRDLWSGHWKRARQAGSSQSVVEYRVNGISGVRWLRSHLATVCEDGLPSFSQGMTFDVTDWKMGGQSIIKNPSAPLVRPLDHLVEAMMMAVTAAEQAGFASMGTRLRDYAMLAGRLLASSIMREPDAEDEGTSFKPVLVPGDANRRR